MRNRWWAPASLAALALIGTACGSSGTSSSGPPGTSSGAASSGAASSGASTAALATTKIGSATVLTTSKGFTIYWFAADTAGKSNCNGSCAKYWPPVKGPVTAMTGVTGTLGTITRSDGTTQETWNGHPLYTYVGDTAPGQAKGNGLNLSGGIWHEVVVAGTAAPAPSSSSSSGGGGSGY
jgi:predicted lipoprotein with Yx(FWY)xxD motif